MREGITKTNLVELLGHEQIVPALTDPHSVFENEVGFNSIRSVEFKKGFIK